MLKRLSGHYQKDIALGFITLFIVSGLNSLKAEASMAHSRILIEQSGNRVPARQLLQVKNNYDELKNLKFPLAKAIGFEKEKKGNRLLLSTKSDFQGSGSIGPSQPEMNGFKSVGSDNMVSPFTGDFSYNIPLFDVGGYPINMFYNSGITMDQESSWLGLGWNINPGTITRNMRGLPDDFNGTDSVKKEQSFRKDETWGVTTGADIKLTGIPFLGFGLNLGASYNNKLGIAIEAGTHASITLGKNAGNNKTANLSFGAGINASARSGSSITPSISLSLQNQQGHSGGLTGSIGVGYTYSSRMGLSSMHLDANANVGVSANGTYIDKKGALKQFGKSSVGSSFNSTLSFAYPSIMPSISKQFTKSSFSINTSVGFEYWWVNPTFKLGGYYTKTFIHDDDKKTYHRAYGMLHYQNANNDDEAMLDFNRANDGIYTPASPAIAMPVYTYDVFSINGEGTGGSFRAYRSDIGHARDAKVVTKEEQGAFGLDLGFGNLMHGGAEMSYVYTPTSVGDLKTSNATGDIFSFDKNEGIRQAVYFKNPGEKSVPDAAYQQAISNEDMVRFKLGSKFDPKPMLLPTLVRYDKGNNILGEKAITAATRKSNRDRRTQVINFFTAEETEDIGMNKRIYSYKTAGAYSDSVIFSANCIKTGIDSFHRNHDVDHFPLAPTILGGEEIKFRKKHHISEIDVLGSDGRKYVYGLPVYNKRQVEVTFSINPTTDKKGNTRVEYVTGDNTDSNNKGRDWIVDKQEMPPYTHSYLLTELLSPNYVDVTGNGITEDDMGDAVKFNYSKFDDYNWRTPVGNKTASYSEGLKTDLKDDKAHYIYGERESWYLYSIESKNMVARFYVKDDRKDGRSVNGENDGSLKTTAGMQRLERISLFSKADLVKYGNAAKPIKTVHFFNNNYKLCKNISATGKLGSNSIDTYGKLTLDSIWITYNGNFRKPKSRYVFYYPSDNNPDYDFEMMDRWGNYKSANDNPVISGTPNHISNADFPYSIQDEVKANKNAAAWTMNKILLPSGAVIKVDYESDSYAYVQDKKAACMYKILGFGNTTTPDLSSSDINKLYSGSTENEYVYVQLPYEITETDPIIRKRELVSRYLQDFKQLYLKLAVEMPTGSGLAGIAGIENIGIYADFSKDNGCDLVSPGVAWIKVNRLNNDRVPMVQGALQFLMQQHPGKAFKGYDMSENSGGEAIVGALGGMIHSLGGLVKGEFNLLMADGKCQKVDLSRSFVRLTNPYRSKLGGGLRVKRVTLNDNWQKMTNQLKATYGQEYNYTTSEVINGTVNTISSGVAAWEPSVGGDENPHREIMRYLDHNKGGPYDYGSIELPLGEIFYPGAMVGYSRVEVLSIHRGDTIKNRPTRQVTEFYTNKEFPYKSTATLLTGDANLKHDPPKIMQLLKIDLKKYITLSQGFLVETNDMNGKEKSQAIYTADNAITPVSHTKYFYNTKETDKTFSFNHVFPTLDSAHGTIRNSLIGREIELMTDFREHSTQTLSVNVHMNFDLAMWGVYPIPIGMVLTPVTKELTMYRSAAALKLVTHYGMIDSIVVIDKGSQVSTKNLVYDAQTGNPILTRTQNEHNKPLYNFTYPAFWAYSGMGPAYKNIDATYRNLKFEHGILTNPPEGLLDVLESGDELYVLRNNSEALERQLPCDINEATNTPWTTLKATDLSIKKIWAVNTSKTGNSPSHWVFMDANGNPFNANIFIDEEANAKGANIKIIRSGKRNMLDASAGSVTSLETPIVNNKLVFTESTRIIQSGAATYSDHWRVDNSFYIKDSVVKQTRWAPVRTGKVPSTNAYSIGMYKYNGTSSNYQATHFLNEEWLLSRTQSFENKTKASKKKQKSWLLFDFNDNTNLNPPLGPGSKILSAKLDLYSHSGSNIQGPVNHYFYYENSHNNSYNYGHGPNDPHMYVNTFRNDFKISRMIGQWSPNDNPNWVSYHYGGYENIAPENQVGVFGTQPINPSKNHYANENGIEFTNVFRGMLKDKLDPAKQYSTGIKLSMVDDSDEKHDAHVCFFSRAISSPKYSFPGPAIHIEYYDCAEAYPFGYTPPSNQKVAACQEITFRQLFCRSKFTENKSVNPYVEGIFGNWRVDSSYVYYGERKESDPEVAVDLRSGGTIKAYQSFWTLAPTDTDDPLSRNLQAASVWVWNSAITQYNRKGYEIENTDPLGRFNAGVYGYNQHLPIAAANNARVREILFDGFEDYGYRTDADCITCKPHRHFNYTTAISTSQLETTQKHTGAHSLKISAGQNVVISAPVTNLEIADRNYSFRLKDIEGTITSSSLSNTNNGAGLEAKYYNHANGYNTPLEPGVNSSAALVTQQNQELKLVHPGGAIYGDYFSVKWKGKLQAPVTGYYKFTGLADNGFKVKLDQQQITSEGAWTNGHQLNNVTTNEILLTMGQVYDLEVWYYDWWGGEGFNLLWEASDGTNMLITRRAIPKTALYMPGVTQTNTVVNTTVDCIRLDSSNIRGNGLTDTFSLINGKKMLLSAWVKVGTANCCYPATYANDYTNSITISYDNGNYASSLQPAGSIIEGWQRYEHVFTIPSDVSVINVSMNNNINNGNTSVFFDDIRIQPFNSNLKSFVYHPSNLRLMAELDENNYASFYEYDDDGTLTRVKKETIRGVKTITETRSATQKEIRKED